MNEGGNKNLCNNDGDKWSRSSSAMGCTMDAISPEMVQIVGLKVHQLME